MTKKSQNNSLRQKAKKYILHKNVRTQNTQRAFTAVVLVSCQIQNKGCFTQVCSCSKWHNSTLHTPKSFDVYIKKDQLLSKLKHSGRICFVEPALHMVIKLGPEGSKSTRVIAKKDNCQSDSHCLDRTDLASSG